MALHGEPWHGFAHAVPCTLHGMVRHGIGLRVMCHGMAWHGMALHGMATASRLPYHVAPRHHPAMCPACTMRFSAHPPCVCCRDVLGAMAACLAGKRGELMQALALHDTRWAALMHLHCVQVISKRHCYGHGHGQSVPTRPPCTLLRQLAARCTPHAGTICSMTHHMCTHYACSKLAGDVGKAGARRRDIFADETGDRWKPVAGAKLGCVGAFGAVSAFCMACLFVPGSSNAPGVLKRPCPARLSPLPSHLQPHASRSWMHCPPLWPPRLPSRSRRRLLWRAGRLARPQLPRSRAATSGMCCPQLCLARCAHGARTSFFMLCFSR